MRLKAYTALLVLSFGALLVHGYHPCAEDAEIYLPGVERILHPELFPFGAQFFQSHAHLTAFPNLIAASARLTHLPFDLLLLVWQMVSIFLFLLGCYELSGKCFTDARARWAGVGLLAALLTLPVAGTALYIMDQYVNPRNLNVFATIFAIVRVLDRKYVQAGLFLALAAAIHPLMWVYAASYCVLLVILQNFEVRFASLGCLLPLIQPFEAPSGAHHEAAPLHSYFYLIRWKWYEWLGAVAPLPILWWIGRVARSKRWLNVDLMCRALVIYGTSYVVAGLALSIPARFESLGRLQPMRSLYLLYILMFLILGGFLGEFVLKDQVWRWVALFLPLCTVMFVVQRALFPASAHIEWPGTAPRNPWVQAFLWIRHNTPSDALFALDPDYTKIAGEDEEGFRAIAERSMLADVNDSGAVSMFPSLAEEWSKEMQVRAEWRKFGLNDFQQLKANFGVNWVVVQQPGVPGLSCPYQNQVVQVCRLN